MRTKPCVDCGASFTSNRSRCQPCYGKYRWKSSPVAYDSERDLNKYRRYNLKKAFGLTLAAYDALLESQGGKCAICKVDACPSGKSLAVDHDHQTGKIRALLCMHCNTGLGKFFDRPDLLREAALYLEKHAE